MNLKRYKRKCKTEEGAVFLIYARGKYFEGHNFQNE